MRKILILGFATILCMGCSKNETGIQGTWTWIGSSGGIAGKTETPESLGIRQKLKIDENTVEQYIDGKLKSSYNYTLSSGESILGGQRDFILRENSDIKMSYVVDKDNLVLTGECFDCFTSSYERR